MDTGQLHRDLSPEEMKDFIFNTTMFGNGVIRDIPEKTLQKYMSNPEMYKNELAKYATYQYITDGDVFQLFDLVRVLPNLNYKIKSLKVNSKSEKYNLDCRRVLKELNHKELTRDILTQLITTGTVVGLWVGKEKTKDKENPYLMIFDDLNYFFPGRRKNGKWTVWCDLSYFDTTNSVEDKYELISNLAPYVTVDDYLNYKKHGATHRYIEFPVERSICLRTHVVKRNQRFGIPWNTQAIYDIKHKEKLRNLEKVAANKVMNAVAVLTLGIEGGDSTYKKLGEKLTRSVFQSVKKGLAENKEGEMSVVGLPEWGKLEYPDQRTDVLDPDKIETINEDINNSTGVSRALTNGVGGNYATAKLNLDIIFNRIGELLEIIESEVYNKLLKIILPNSAGGDYYLEYEKSYPLTVKEKADYFKGLVDKGYAVTPLLEILGVDPTEYIEQSVYEIEELKLREKIIPPLTSYTLSDNAEGTENGRPTSDDATNENTITSNNNNANSAPDANV